MWTSFSFFALLSGALYFILNKVRYGLKGNNLEITLFEFLYLFSIGCLYTLISAFWINSLFTYAIIILNIGIEEFYLKYLYFDFKLKPINFLLYKTFDFTVHMQDIGKNDEVPRLRDELIQAQYIEDSLKNFEKGLDKRTKSIIDILNMLPPNEEILKKPDRINFLMKLMQANLNDLHNFYHARLKLIDVLCSTLPESEKKEKIKEYRAKYLEYEKDFGNIDFLNKEGISGERKIEQFYHLFNSHRNRTSKELNKMEGILSSLIKESNYGLWEPLKKNLNKDFIESKKNFNDNQGYLLKRVEQITEQLKKEEKNKN